MTSTKVVERISYPSTVAVTGATGKTGKFVVEELLNQKIKVVALIRNETKANEILDTANEDLNVIKCDLTSAEEIERAIQGCDAAVWCATGFSENPNETIIDKIKKLWDLTFASKKGGTSIDITGVPALAKCIEESSSFESELPRLVMLSAAGVTRPSWSDEKKEKFKGAADIPIVRLNPFNILNIKAESEENLRETGVKYCIVRPCGLNDKWPSGSRPILSQGDVGVGRINRKDVAKVLVEALISPEAVGKTFEVIGLAGPSYQPGSIRPLLEKLQLDSEELSEDYVTANYNIMQQLLPGEKQDAAALAMGQTYEQLDKGEDGRFGERGKEDLVTAAPSVTSR